MDIKFEKLTHPTAEIAECFSKWENDPSLIHLIRPHPDQDSLDRRESITVEDLERRLEHSHIYLIYLDGELVGEMDFQVDPKHLYKKDISTAWIGIVIGEESARGKGLGLLAMQYLEKEIEGRGLQRLELGVFEFNTNAIKLYQKAGYKEIGRIPDFTYWQGKFWEDIRMEKLVGA